MLWLRIHDLSMGYDGRSLFSGLSVELDAGGTIVVSGANGAGKSTFLKILAGLARADGGSVTLENDDLTRVTGRGELQSRRENLGYAGPDVNLYEELSAAENLDFIARLRGLTIDGDALLERIGLAKRARRSPVKSYSSGMRQRLRLAASLVSSPDLLLWDEPTAMLDEAGRRMVEEILSAHAQAGGLAVIATNDTDEIARWGGRRIHFGPH